MKKKIFIVLIIVLFISFLSIFLYDKFVLNLVSNDYFDIEYDNTWECVNKSKDSIYLSKDNNSYIQIVASPLENNTKDTSDIHFNLHKKFLDENKSYTLLSSGETKVGKKYYDAFEYLFKNDNYESLLIILVSDEKVIQINYISYITNFLFDLDYFYDVVNTLEL